MNSQLAKRVLQIALEKGVEEFCVCPSARNAPLVSLFVQNEKLVKYHWFEERSAAFVALGRSRGTGKPVAVVTTSGTAAGELLPAAMEAFYTGVPLLLITADRPRRFRGTGAPQSAEQVGLFGRYIHYEEDLADDDESNLSLWDLKGPAHINVCFEEPLQWSGEHVKLSPTTLARSNQRKSSESSDQAFIFQNFLENTQFPFVVVGGLKEYEELPVKKFLLQLGFPVFLEAISGLREDADLAHLRIHRSDRIWQAAAAAQYPIDGVLRIGGIPTFRLWRDLEDKQGEVNVCSISSQPFTGLSWGDLIYIDLSLLDSAFELRNMTKSSRAVEWLHQDKKFQKNLAELIAAEPLAEPSLIHSLSLEIAEGSLVYLGNSMPIREWDLAATEADRGFAMFASRGVNGIDGQISTFLGLSESGRENWAIIGDLTALYDMVGPWILRQMPENHVTIVIVNNAGGQIFSRMFVEKEFLHEHRLNFEPLAAMWGMQYHLVSNWTEKLSTSLGNNKRLIELQPDPEATKRFWHRYKEI